MPEQSPTLLRDMIQEALDNGVTYRELEARAVDPQTGKTASRSVFFDTVSGKLDRMPYDYHLRAVATALRAPYETVRRAAIAQWLAADDDRTLAATPPAGFDAAEWASYDEVGRQAILDAMHIADRRRNRNHPNEGAREYTA